MKSVERQRVVVFPDHFLPVEEWDLAKLIKYPTVICSSNPKLFSDAIGEKTRQLIQWSKKASKGKRFPAPKGECDFKIIRLDNLWESDLFVALQGFLVFDPPLESRSKKQGSSALYWAANKEKGLLLQFLPVHCITSTHNHELSNWNESYYLLAGMTELRTCENRHHLRYQLTEASPIVPILKPDVIHQISTTSQPSLILIQITGDPNWFDRWLTGEGHTFKQFPEPRQLITKDT